LRVQSRPQFFGSHNFYAFFWEFKGTSKIRGQRRTLDQSEVSCQQWGMLGVSAHRNTIYPPGDDMRKAGWPPWPALCRWCFRVVGGPLPAGAVGTVGGAAGAKRARRSRLVLHPSVAPAVLTVSRWITEPSWLSKPLTRPGASSPQRGQA